MILLSEWINSIHNWRKAQDNVKALNATIELSEELVRIRKKSFTEGMATSTEVIDAETMLANVKVARLAAYYEYDVALMNFFHSAAHLNNLQTINLNRNKQ